MTEATSAHQGSGSRCLCSQRSRGFSCPLAKLPLLGLQLRVERRDACGRRLSRRGARACSGQLAALLLRLLQVVASARASRVGIM